MNRRHFLRHLGTLAAAAALATPIGREMARRVEDREPGKVVRWGDVEFTICDFDPRVWLEGHGIEVASFDEERGIITLAKPLPAYSLASRPSARGSAHVRTSAGRAEERRPTGRLSSRTGTPWVGTYARRSTRSATA